MKQSISNSNSFDSAGRGSNNPTSVVTHSVELSVESKTASIFIVHYWVKNWYLHCTTSCSLCLQKWHGQCVTFINPFSHIDVKWSLPFRCSPYLYVHVFHLGIIMSLYKNAKNLSTLDLLRLIFRALVEICRCVIISCLNWAEKIIVSDLFVESSSGSLVRGLPDWLFHGSIWFRVLSRWFANAAFLAAH